MATYLLDTNIIIDALNRKRGRDALLKSLLLAGNMLACCAINVAEVYAGMRPSERGRTERFLDSLDYYEISAGIAREAGLLKQEWARKGVTLSVPDLLIAAVALANDLTLITDNIRDFPMPQLKLYPPRASLQ